MENENVEKVRLPPQPEAAKKGKSKGKPKEQRVRKLCLITYHDRETIEGVLQNRPVRAAAYIYHDKDVNEDGTPKPAHWHIMLCANNAVTVGQVRRWFPPHQNTLGQVMEDDERAEGYLTHENEPDKVKYSRDDIVLYGQGWKPFHAAWTSSNRDNEAVEIMLDDIIDGVSKRTMCRRYGRDYIRNQRAYDAYARQMAYEERRATQGALDEWQMLCYLHERGTITDYELVRYESMYIDAAREVAKKGSGV